MNFLPPTFEGLTVTLKILHDRWLAMKTDILGLVVKIKVTGRRRATGDDKRRRIVGLAPRSGDQIDNMQLEVEEGVGGSAATLIQLPVASTRSRSSFFYRILHDV